MCLWKPRIHVAASGRILPQRLNDVLCIYIQHLHSLMDLGGFSVLVIVNSITVIIGMQVF